MGNGRCHLFLNCFCHAAKHVPAQNAGQEFNAGASARILTWPPFFSLSFPREERGGVRIPRNKISRIEPVNLLVGVGRAVCLDAEARRAPSDAPYQEVHGEETVVVQEQIPARRRHELPSLTPF
jgi:hypothetical protein